MDGQVVDGQVVDGQVDIAVSRLRSAGLFLIAVGLTATAAWMLHVRPETRGHAMAPGGYTEFMLWLGLIFFGAASLVGAPRMFRSGTLVSVGRRGIFDRRLSTDWIPWDAIEDLRPVMLSRQRFFVLRVDPALSAALPILPRRRAGARFTGLGAHGYALSGNDLEGGFAALGEALSAAAAWRIPPGTGTTR
ncbi:hypothetical protein [Methylobacterium sp. WL19]|uniref:hypothetical protein n=1 Tax=Methylobacterium sp. WL19 TaxID=2603896 RepID=UPI0011CA5074|nr:hypothetical protein [Methylobacterium sp. WL19]TXN24713.1 hypothetical protein FV220_19995 [Methylobacterium sp. WL19]